MTTATPPLNTVQRWMKDALINPGGTDQQSISDTLLAGNMLDAASCLAIYQRSYILRLRKCLAEQFPATYFALGEPVFNDFADQYLSTYPSQSYTLYELGRRFPAWLEETRPDKDAPEHEREDWINFMVDLAHYEHTLFDLFDAPGQEEKAHPNHQTSDEKLILQPCLTLAQYRYPVAWYYHEVRAKNNPQFPARAAVNMVILRHNYQTTTYPVSSLHFRFLSNLKRLGSVKSALLDIANWTQQPLKQVTLSWQDEVRQAWLDAGFFALG